MTDRLRECVGSLHARATGLAAAASEATRIVTSLERALVEEIPAGVSAESEFRHREMREMSAVPEEDGVPEEPSRYFLAFGPLDGRPQIHVVTRISRRARHGRSNVSAGEVRIPWSLCPDGLKLSASSVLPGLFDSVIEAAERLAERAEKAAARLAEMARMHGSSP